MYEDDVFYYSRDTYKNVYDDTEYNYILSLINEFRKDPDGVDISVVDRIKDYYQDVVLHKLNTTRENLLIGAVKKNTNCLYFKDKNKDNPIIVLDLIYNVYYNKYYNKTNKKESVSIGINESSRDKLNNNHNNNNNDNNDDINYKSCITCLIL